MSRLDRFALGSQPLGAREGARLAAAAIPDVRWHDPDHPVPTAVAGHAEPVPDAPTTRILRAHDAPLDDALPVDVSHGDVWDGYARAMLEVARTLPWHETPRPSRRVAVLGTFHHRIAADTRSDLGALAGLLKGVGLAMLPPLPSGVPLRDLQHLTSAAVVLLLPYARPVAAELRALVGRRRVVEVDLPIGVSGSTRFLREVGAALGAPPATVEAIVERRVAEVRRGMAHLEHHAVRGMRVALFADAPLAAGLATSIRELGIRITVLGTRDRSLGGPAEVRRVLEANGLGLDEDCVVLDRPSLRQVREVLLERVARSDVDVVIGSSVELDRLRHATSLPASVKGVPMFEVGYPSVHEHGVGQVPTLGFRGAARWADRLLASALNPRVGGHPRARQRPPGPREPASAARGEVVERYALKGMHLAKMTGVSLGSHAIRDGFLLQHVGVGCKYKAAAQVAIHDWGTHPNQREAWTQVGEVSLIRGSSARIGPFARSWYLRRRPGFMFLISAYFIELTGESIADVLDEVQPTLPCPITYLSTAAPNGGFYEGYAETQLAVLDRQPLKSPATAPQRAAVIGWFFHRYELDQEADVSELRGLIAAGGMEPGPILFSGVPHAELATAHEAGTFLQLPYARPIARKLKRRLKHREVVELDLPIGLSGTARFVRAVAAARGTVPDEVEAWIRDAEARVTRALAPQRARLAGLRVGLFADTPLAAGLATLLTELGCQVAVVGLRDTVLGGASAFHDALSRDGTTLPDDVTVWERPSVRRVRTEVLPRILDGSLDVVVGSSVELSTLARVPEVAPALARTLTIEVGFPATRAHPATALPTVGHAGVLAWARALLEGTGRPRVGDAVLHTEAWTSCTT